MQDELPEALHKRILALSVTGDTLAEKREFEKAIASYNEAWNLVPEPKNHWEASTWLLAAIADSCFLAGYFTSGSEALQYALSCPGGSGNPFIHLRLGQCELERGQLDAAADHLCRAYMLEGSDIFATEPSKYFEFLKTRIKPPASGQW